MIAYVDSSVILRRILGQSEPLAEWAEIHVAVVSDLVEVECLRTLDRLRLRDGVPDEAIATLRATVFRILDASHAVQTTPQVLRRAASPFPTQLGALDAIHLATALAWRESGRGELVMATHDVALAVASRALGLSTIGA